MAKHGASGSLGHWQADEKTFVGLSSERRLVTVEGPQKWRCSFLPIASSSSKWEQVEGAESTQALVVECRISTCIPSHVTACPKITTGTLHSGLRRGET
jgi:hypothetical protein